MSFNAIRENKILAKNSEFTVSTQFACVISFLFAGLTFISSPLIGMQSDRSTFSVGKRRPMMILGAIALW